jgi:hypothetical protein
MKTMTLCLVAYILLAVLLVVGQVNAVSMAFWLTAAAMAWALVMWNETPEPPDVEIE